MKRITTNPKMKICTIDLTPRRLRKPNVPKEYIIASRLKVNRPVVKYRFFIMFIARQFTIDYNKSTTSRKILKIAPIKVDFTFWIEDLSLRSSILISAST